VLRGSKAGTQNPTSLTIQFQGAGGTVIAGSLLIPPGAGKTTPGVVIVPDNGYTDLTGISPPAEVPDPLYADLASSLASVGVASLRYDRRGTGLSLLPAQSSITFSEVVGDAKAAVRFLSGRADVDRSHLVVLGDGQGGLVALALAAEDPAVQAVVLLSTPGRPVISTMEDELMATAPPALASTLVTQLKAVVKALLAGRPEPAPDALAGPLQPLLPPGEGPYLSTLFSLIPTSVIAKVHVPVLVVQGGQDPFLSPADMTDLAKAAGGPVSEIYVPGDTGTLLGTAGSRQLSGPGPVTGTSFTHAPGTTAGGSGAQSTSIANAMAQLHLPAALSGQRDEAVLKLIDSWVRSH
jgi:pimeloyl-ACP methyl ester carboxylesterase